MGAGTFEFIHQLIRPTHPIDEADRVVGIWNIDAETNSQEYRALFDYANWRTNLTTP